MIYVDIVGDATGSHPAAKVKVSSMVPIFGKATVFVFRFFVGVKKHLPVTLGGCGDLNLCI